MKEAVSFMNPKDRQIVFENYYRFNGISSRKKQEAIVKTLSYCKEIRDTAYPMQDSYVTELKIVEFQATKEKDLIYVNGSLSLTDGDRNENRCFEAYIMDGKDDGKTRVFLDITRLCVNDEPKMIRTSEEISEGIDSVVSITAYSAGETGEEKLFTTEFRKPVENLTLKEHCLQLSAL
jgi:hypothetical protein